MRYTRFFYLVMPVVLVSLLFGISGCLKLKGPDQQQPASLVTDAYMARAVDAQLKPVNASNTFYVDADILYLSLKLNNAPANTQVMAKLTYLEGEAADLANTNMFNESQSGHDTMYMAFAVKPPPGGFPQGNYRMDVSANGQPQASIPFKVQNLAAPKGWPKINRFSASTNRIPQGQSVILTWDVSDATRITLQPEIGTIPAVGTRSVSPTVTTTYVLTASNDAGASKGQVSIEVTAPVSGVPDLSIKSIWLEGKMLYYTIRNGGTLESAPSYCHLYVNNIRPAMGSESYVQALKPGQEKTLTFSSYEWPYDISSVNLADAIVNNAYDPSVFNHVVKVCADARDEVQEGNENNNCRTQLVGFLWDYDLLAVSHMAIYSNSWDTLGRLEGITQSDPKGAHIKMGDGSLMMIPEHKPQGFIRGKWGEVWEERMYWIKIPIKTKFIARVGLHSSAAGSDGVTFKLGFLDSTDSLRWLDSKKMTVPDKYEDWVVDLTDQQGYFGYFLLQVDAGNDWANDYAVWKTARLQQFNDP